MTTPRLQRLNPIRKPQKFGKPLQLFPPADGALIAGCLFPGESPNSTGGCSLPAQMVIYHKIPNEGRCPVPSSPRGVTESCTGCVLPPMALMAWHSYCPWSCRATRPTRRVPVDSTLCRRSLGKGPPGRRSSSLIHVGSPQPVDDKAIFDFVRSSRPFAALEGGLCCEIVS